MSEIVVHQVGFLHSAALDAYVRSKLTALQRREQAHDRPWAVEVYVKAVARSPASVVQSYSARIAVKLPWQARRMVVSGVAPRPRAAFVLAVDKIEKRLRRDSRKQESGRRVRPAERPGFT